MVARKSKLVDLVSSSNINKAVMTRANTFLKWTRECPNYDKALVGAIENTSPVISPAKKIASGLCSSLQVNSVRKYSCEPFDANNLIALFENSFSKQKNSNHRVYPSAGALYPVVPLLVILNNHAVDNLTTGIYGLDDDTSEFSLFNLGLDISGVKRSISDGNRIINSMFICYAFSINRALMKYGVRGIRHTFIEIGEMAQTFRMNGLKHVKNFGDVNWSGYDDILLKNAISLTDLYPGMVQFFGKVTSK